VGRGEGEVLHSSDDSVSRGLCLQHEPTVHQELATPTRDHLLDPSNTLLKSPHRRPREEANLALEDRPRGQKCFRRSVWFSWEYIQDIDDEELGEPFCGSV